MHHFMFVHLFFQQVFQEMGYEDDGQRTELINVKAKKGANPPVNKKPVASQVQIGVQYADVATTSTASWPGTVKAEVPYQEIDHIATKVT